MNSLDLLVGRTVESVRVSNDELDLIFDHDAFRFYHLQDCCESVSIHDISGDLNNLIGSPILEATEDIVLDEWPSDVQAPWCVDSYTWTTHTFRTKDHTVVVRWFGESNGYYSESVYCHLTHKPIHMD